MLEDEQIPPIDITKYEWGKRAMMPNAPFIQNPDNTRSTHKMAAEVDENGHWHVFPTIVQLPDGKLYQFQNPQLAFAWNKQRGETINFEKNKDMALKFAEGLYKRGTPLEEKGYY